MKLEAEDFASVANAAMDVFVNNATDALVDLAITGKESFKEFADAAVQDLIRIITRLLIMQAISAIAGGGGSPAAVIPGLPGQGAPREHGGTVQPGRSFLVGEAGPELFKPDRTGTIVPTPTAQAPPQVNVQVVNVTSEEDVPRAIEAGGADTAIINAIQRNASRIKQVIS